MEFNGIDTKIIPKKPGFLKEIEIITEQFNKLINIETFCFIEKLNNNSQPVLKTSQQHEKNNFIILILQCDIQEIIKLISLIVAIDLIKKNCSMSLSHEKFQWLLIFYFIFCKFKKRLRIGKKSSCNFNVN